jgi:hypothetical protein
MVGIDAGANATQVVEGQAVRDRANEVFVREAVSVALPPTPPERPIAAILSVSSPFPTGIREVDLGDETPKGSRWA